MSEKYKRIALVPAYKPDNTMFSVVGGLLDNGFEVVVVNDGSGQEYDNIFDKLVSAKVIGFSENKGKGEALKLGTHYIYENFKAPYIVLTIDSDGQHRVEDAVNLVDYTENNPDEFVIGKRNLKLKGTPLRSRVGNNITHFGFRQATLTHLNETQTGLRAFSDKVIDKVIDVKGSRYEYEMIVLMTLARLGVKISEIDIETVYEDGNSSSHFNPLPDSVRIYWSILKFSWQALLCFAIDLAVFVIAFACCSGPSLRINGVFSDFYLILICNAVARVISTVCDLIINKRVIFRKIKPLAFILYFLLVIAVFAADTFIVTALSMTGVVPVAGKILSALLITWLSRIAQTKLFEAFSK